MTQNTFGDVVAEGWKWLATRFRGVALDEWTLMPNHLHGIIVRVDTSSADKPLGGLIGAFKTVTTKRINQLRGTPGVPIWQRNYWEHIIRDDVELDSIRFYIKSNAANWANDDLNVPVRIASP